jgi:hypothetical protein
VNVQPTQPRRAAQQVIDLQQSRVDFMFGRAASDFTRNESHIGIGALLGHSLVQRQQLISMTPHGVRHRIAQLGDAGLGHQDATGRSRRELHTGPQVL